MYKAVGAVLIVLCCIYLGISKKREMTMRLYGLKQFRAMIEQLRVEIGLKMIPLPRAINLVGKDFNNECFIKCSQKILSVGGSAAFEESLDEASPQYRFSKDDISAIKTLSVGLGKCDLDNQIRQIDYCISRIDLAIEEAKAEYIKKKTVYVSGYTLIGVFVVLVLL